MSAAGATPADPTFRRVGFRGPGVRVRRGAEPRGPRVRSCWVSLSGGPWRRGAEPRGPAFRHVAWRGLGVRRAGAGPAPRPTSGCVGLVVRGSAYGPGGPCPSRPRSRDLPSAAGPGPAGPAFRRDAFGWWSGVVQSATEPCPEGHQRPSGRGVLRVVRVRWAPAGADGGPAMKLRSVHGVIVAGVAAGCWPAAPVAAGRCPGRQLTPRQRRLGLDIGLVGLVGGGKPTAVAGGMEPVGSPAGTRPPVPAKPVIGAVWSTPALECEGHFCAVLGAGTVTFRARVSGATSVAMSLVSTGTGPDRTRRVLGVDRDGRDGWSVRWTYPDEPLLSHLVVTARGPGGTTEALPFGVYHPDRTGPTVARVWTQPGLACRDGWCTLPPGAGVLTIHAEVLNALSGVSFFLDPVDSEPVQIATGYVRDGRDYSVTWRIRTSRCGPGCGSSPATTSVRRTSAPSGSSTPDSADPRPRPAPDATTRRRYRKVRRRAQGPLVSRARPRRRGR